MGQNGINCDFNVSINPNSTGTSVFVMSNYGLKGPCVLEGVRPSDTPPPHYPSLGTRTLGSRLLRRMVFPSEEIFKASV